MTRNLFAAFALVAVALLPCGPSALAQPAVPAPPVDKWVTAEGEAAGADPKAKDEAVAAALRKTVEQACGVFIKAQTKTQDYQTIYDKIIANTPGYVLEYKTDRTWVEGQITHAKVTARVSTRKFEESWAAIAHTVSQENNPRVLIAISEDTHWTATTPSLKVGDAGIVQGKIEDFFLDKGIQLVDRGTAEKVNKRDLILASIKDDTAEVAALGARFKADVVIIGEATAKFGKELDVQGAKMYQFVVSLRVRAVRTDSAQIIASKAFTQTVTSLQGMGGEDKALAKLAEDAAPRVLEAVVEAWRKQSNVSRNIRLEISGMDYKAYQAFRKEVSEIKGVQSLRQREITESVANIDVEYDFSTESLADKLTELKDTKLEITETNPNRLKMKVVK